MAVNRTGKENRRRRSRRAALHMTLLVSFLLSGCGAFNLGEITWLKKTDPDVEYWHLKKAVLTAGSVAHPRDSFDHTLQPRVFVIFTPANEKNKYHTKTIWYDPSGQEYRTIRQTHDKKEIEDQGEHRPQGGSVISHSMSTKELYDHEPGLWKVEIYYEDDLARRMDFTVR